jgi:hypothetical protein
MEPTAPAPPRVPAAPSPAQQRRLRQIWRSAGWPCQDVLEVELIAAGLVDRVRQPSGHETLRVSDAGVAALALGLQRNRARADAHEALVERVAREMLRAGRLAWRGLAMRAQLDSGWVHAMPDVFSIRNTTVPQYLEPVVHEIKVKRSDLLADLKRPDKRAAYLQLGGECWYVLREGIAQAQEIPPECGVLVATASALELARPAPKRAASLPFSAWMALARATPVPGWLDDDAQPQLGAAAPER